ncbi:hypothetical protein V8E54_002519, partial [Elaphomyces granulatus]
PPNRYDTTKRYTFAGGECVVFGWPSSGGMLRMRADAVDLEYLGLDRFQESTRSQNPTEEDAFCQKMRKLGAKLWQNEEHYIHVLLGEWELTEEEAVELKVGWPAAGGVWVLKSGSRRARPRGIAQINLALNMEERCRVIEKLGGKFYANPEECPDLAGLFQDTTSEL